MENLTSEAVRPVATRWLAALNAAVETHAGKPLRALFLPDSHWRNLGGVSWPLTTFSGADRISDELSTRGRDTLAQNFALDDKPFEPRHATIAGRPVIEFAVRFDTRHGPGLGVARLAQPPDEDGWKAWTFSTALDFDRICEDRRAGGPATSHRRDFSEASFADQRRAALDYDRRDPDVLVVGGGHAGLSAAVELQRLGLDVLVIDRETRIGDNWRLRYNGLKLHNKTPVNHLRYMNFPVTFPEYLPKDKIANWLEQYVDAMDINFWTETAFAGAVYDAEERRWIATIDRAGNRRELRPKHIVVATSVSGTPNIPDIPTLGNFAGPVLHSSAFSAGLDYKVRSALVIGSGTSAHDICQELHAHGVRATMVQRNTTLVVNIDPSAQIYDTIYLGEGPTIEVRDLLNSSIPYPVARLAHKAITQRVKQLDAPLLERLERVGFRLDFGEDDTGWPLKFRNRGGGYYFNVGCSDLLAEGSVGLVQAADIATFTPGGLTLKNGRALPFDLVVLATGYKGLSHIVETQFGGEVAHRVGPIWGIDPQHHELRNMWTKTPQPGLWFTGGAFSMCRIYSRVMALQIDAIENGGLEK